MRGGGGEGEREERGRKNKMKKILFRNTYKKTEKETESNGD